MKLRRCIEHWDGLMCALLQSLMMRLYGCCKIDLLGAHGQLHLELDEMPELRRLAAQRDLRFTYMYSFSVEYTTKCSTCLLPSSRLGVVVSAYDITNE